MQDKARYQNRKKVKKTDTKNMYQQTIRHILAFEIVRRRRPRPDVILPACIFNNTFILPAQSLPVGFYGISIVPLLILRRNGRSRPASKWIIKLTTTFDKAGGGKKANGGLEGSQLQRREVACLSLVPTCCLLLLLL